MKVLFVTYDLGQIALACKIAGEGNEVRVLERLECWKNKIKRPEIKFVFDNFQRQLEWVGKAGLIVFDYVGDGKLQDKLRKQGYSVFGGCKIGDELEEKRQFGQDTFSEFGMETRNAVSFENITEAIKYVEKNRKKWVVKQNGQMDKGLNYVGQLNDAKDVLSILKSYRRIFKKNNIKIDLHERADGVEIAAGRFYNGEKWVGPVFVNLEHKNLFKGNLGPKTHEMGTLMWCEKKW